MGTCYRPRERDTQTADQTAPDDVTGRPAGNSGYPKVAPVELAAT
uniref:Uncharacterized protein n=1 Tax=Aeromonas salmonicida subsp. salmonicida TaxID=29491 RepID=A0A8F3IY02_AERSS|nr:hypothetical protein [Aeromonas salmonicida subsp. salmonicida]